MILEVFFVFVLPMLPQIKVRAERKCGEMLRETAESGERATQNKHRQNSVSNDTTLTTLPELGITRDQSSRWQKITALASAGKTQREIAEEVGCGHQTVGRAVYPKRKSSEMDKTPEPTTKAKPMNTNTATNRKPASERAAEGFGND